MTAPAARKFLLAGLLLLAAGSAFGQATAWIDVHTHLQPERGRSFATAVRQAVQLMDQRGVERSLLMPPPFTPGVPPEVVYDLEDMARAGAAPPRFALLGGSWLNLLLHATPAAAVDDGVRARFRARAEEILARGAVGFGEIGALHLSLPFMGSRHPYGEVQPDHPLLLLLADIAAERDVPIDLHCDLVPQQMPLPPALQASPSNPPVLRANLEGLQRLLAHNRKARIVWSHAGAEPLMTRDPQRIQALLTAHPNLYMSLRMGRGLPHPAAALDPGGRLKPAWRQLLAAFPERFMLGSDSFYGTGQQTLGHTAQGAENLARLLQELPAEVAQAIGRDNAVRVFRLAP